MRNFSEKALVDVSKETYDIGGIEGERRVRGVDCGSICNDA